MRERRKSSERRTKERRKLLNENEFRRLIESGKATAADRRKWNERRGKKKRKRQVGI
jgi:hypothetical protein